MFVDCWAVAIGKLDLQNVSVASGDTADLRLRLSSTGGYATEHHYPVIAGGDFWRCGRGRLCRSVARSRACGGRCNRANSSSNGSRVSPEVYRLAAHVCKSPRPRLRQPSPFLYTFRLRALIDNTMRTTLTLGILSLLLAADASPLLVARLDECNPGGGSHGGGAKIPSYCFSSSSTSAYSSSSIHVGTSTSKCPSASPTPSAQTIDECNPGGGSHGGGAVIPSHCYASASSSTSSAYVSPSNMATVSSSKCLPTTTSTYVTDPCNPGGGSHGGGAVLPSYCLSTSTYVSPTAFASASGHTSQPTSKCTSASPSPTASVVDECNPGGGSHGGGAVIPAHCSPSAPSSAYVSPSDLAPSASSKCVPTNPYSPAGGDHGGAAAVSKPTYA